MSNFHDVHLGDAPDRLRWLLDISYMFLVSSARMFLDRGLVHNGGWRLVVMIGSQSR